MADKKITKREVISAMLKEEGIVSNPVYKEYLEHELELLNKKADNKKPTKVQEENENYKAIVLDILAESDKGMTVTEIMGKSEVLGSFSNQKVSALVRSLKEDGKVTKIPDGKKSLFKLA